VLAKPARAETPPSAQDRSRRRNRSGVGSGNYGRWAIELDHSAALEQAVDDGLGEVWVVKYCAPSLEGLVGGDDHRALLQVPLVDDVKEDVGGVAAVREIAELVLTPRRKEKAPNA